MTTTSPARNRLAGLASMALTIGLIASLPAPAQANSDRFPNYDAKPPQAGQPFYTEHQLATNGENGFANYRITALAVTNEGDILASYDGRPTAKDSPGPNSILQRRSTDGGHHVGGTNTHPTGQDGSPDRGIFRSELHR